MIDLKLIGYTVEHFETLLTPDVANMNDDITFGLELYCNSDVVDDLKRGIMRVMITVTAANEGKDDPFAKADGIFHFLFDAAEASEREAINASIRSNGIEIALPIIRGLIVGAASLLSLPPVFSFPHVDPSDIVWEDDSEVE